MMTNHKRHLIIDLVIIVASILFAIAMVRSGFVYDIFSLTHGREILGSFIAGIFFVSVFTVAPAGVMLVQLAQENSLWLVSVFGAMGALVGDLLIFTFMKDRVAEDILYLLRETGWRRWFFILRLRLFRWLTPLLGMIIIASPLPDEIGLALLGISKIPQAIFIPVVLVLDFLGILVVLAVTNAL